MCGAIDIIDHVLATLGQLPDLGFNPRSRLVSFFKNKELRKSVLDCPREDNGKPIMTLAKNTPGAPT